MRKKSENTNFNGFQRNVDRNVDTDSIDTTCLFIILTKPKKELSLVIDNARRSQSPTTLLYV